MSDNGKIAYPVIFTPKDTKNYNSVTTAVTLNIDPVSVVYNGGTAFMITLNGVNGETVAATLIPSIKDVGSYAYAAEAGTGKYTVEMSTNYQIGDAQTLTITPLAAVRLEWSGYTNLVYTGHSVNVTATATELIPGDECLVEVPGGQMIDAACTDGNQYDFSNPVFNDLTRYACRTYNEPDLPKTGDNSRLALWITLMGISVLVLCLNGYGMARSKKN